MGHHSHDPDVGNLPHPEAQKKIGGRGGQKIHKTALRKLIIYLYCVYKRLVRAAYFLFHVLQRFCNLLNYKTQLSINKIIGF